MPLLLKEGKSPSKLAFRKEIFLWSFERAKKINAWNQIPAYASGLCVTGEDKLSFKINFYCFISLLTPFYFPAIEQSIKNKKNSHTLSTIMIWFFHLPLLFSCKNTSPAQITNTKLFCLFQTTYLKTMRNSNVGGTERRINQVIPFEISVFTNCSSFPTSMASLLF